MKAERPPIIEMNFIIRDNSGKVLLDEKQNLAVTRSHGKPWRIPTREEVERQAFEFVEMRTQLPDTSEDDDMLREQLRLITGAYTRKVTEVLSKREELHIEIRRLLDAK